MPTYVIYDAASNAACWLAVQPSEPTPGDGFGVLAVGDGTTLGPGAWDVIDGALVAHAPTFAESRAVTARSAAAHCAVLIAAGFTYSGTLYQIDAGSQANISAMGALALGSITDSANSPWPGGFYWIAADNSHVVMDAPAMYAFARAVAAYVSACVLRLRAIKDAIAAADQATLDAFDVTAGYPVASA
jgi:hypothetical protein